MKVEEGNMEDWRKLSVFPLPKPQRWRSPKNFSLNAKRRELCGVIVYCYPPPACYGRRLVLPRMTMQQLNRHLSIISRVVIHPKYRTIGLGAKIIHETLPLAGTRYVEMIAVMAKYSPFAEKAGMTKIAQQQHVDSVSEVLTTVSELGFNLQLLCSERYVNEKLENLSPKQLSELKSVFSKNKHPRFQKMFALGVSQPFGKTSDYSASIRNADTAKMAKLIKLVGVISQAKVYLFWKKGSANLTGGQ